MKLTKALQGKSMGLTWTVPPAWELVGENDDAAQLTDPQHKVQWWLFWFPGLTLGLGEPRDGEAADIEAAMHHYAKAMFETTFKARREHEAAERAKKSPEELAQEEADGKLPIPEQPRSADGAWSPMVDCERASLGKGAALRTIHRMSYEPGREIIMGHLLVPTAHGLLEARVVAGDLMTGVRESFLLQQKLGDSEAAELAPGELTLTQREIDDPAHDETFQDHSLSRVRRALRWLIADAGVEVLEPAPPHPGGEVVLKKLDCALVPPPRFVHNEPRHDYNIEVFERVGFCGTDGMERLIVQRAHELKTMKFEKLGPAAEKFSRELCETSGLRELAITSDELAVGERRCVLVTARGRGEDGGLLHLFCWLLDKKGRPYFVALLGGDAVPEAVRRDELSAAVKTWRSLTDGKPWWQLW